MGLATRIFLIFIIRFFFLLSSQLKDIAKQRGLKLGTILDHVEKIREKEPNYNIYNLRDGIPKNRFKEIWSAFRKIGVSEGEMYKLAPVKELLGPKYSYEDLRLVRLFL